MTRFTTVNLRSMLGPDGRPARLFTFVNRQPSWVGRLALAAGVVAVFAVALLLIVPAVLLGMLVFLLAAGFATARRWLTRQREPNGALDGRRNVRVIVRGGRAP